MSKLKRMARSFYKNIILKRKFKSYLMSIVDSEYRAQINQLFELTKNSTGTVMKEVPVRSIHPGHKIIYHEYEAWLYSNDSIPIEPIKVVESNGKFIVVDGNHRLTAIKKRAMQNSIGKIMCEVIV